jgi:hypothetical protein
LSGNRAADEQQILVGEDLVDLEVLTCVHETMWPGILWFFQTRPGVWRMPIAPTRRWNIEPWRPDTGHLQRN